MDPLGEKLDAQFERMWLEQYEIDQAQENEAELWMLSDDEMS